MPYSTNPKAQHVWEKARRVKGKNPNLYRRDAQGNLIYKPAYNRDSTMGWQVDHIWPRSNRLLKKSGLKEVVPAATI